MITMCCPMAVQVVKSLRRAYTDQNPTEFFHLWNRSATENTRGINSPSTPTLNPLYSIVLVPLPATRYGCSQFHNSFLFVWTGRRIGAVSGWADIARWVETHESAFSGLDGAYEVGTSLVMKHGPRWKNAPKWLVTELTQRGKTHSLSA